MAPFVLTRADIFPFSDFLLYNAGMTGDWLTDNHLTKCEHGQSAKSIFEPGSLFSHAFQLVVPR